MIADAKKYLDGLSSGRRDEFEDLIIRIRKAAHKLGEENEHQSNRLEEFDNKNLKSDIAKMIPDSDFLFLNKEVTRYRGSVQALFK